MTCTCYCAVCRGYDAQGNATCCQADPAARAPQPAEEQAADMLTRGVLAQFTPRDWQDVVRGLRSALAAERERLADALTALNEANSELMRYQILPTYDLGFANGCEAASRVLAEARAERVRYRAALEFYADQATWTLTATPMNAERYPPVLADGGRTARTALAPPPEGTAGDGGG